MPTDQASMAISQEDEIRESVLRLLNETYRRARGRNSQSLPISTIKRELKGIGYQDREIVGALTFLVDTGWVKVELNEKRFFINGRLTTSNQIRYRISDVGIMHFSGPSRFTSSSHYQGINITNIQGITVVGHNNLVQVRFRDLFESLEHLGQEIRANASISDHDKIECLSDLQTIQSQLSKANPDKGIIKASWGYLSNKIAGIPQFASILGMIVTLTKEILARSS